MISGNKISLNLEITRVYIANDTRNDLVGRYRLIINADIRYDHRIHPTPLTLINTQCKLIFQKMNETPRNFEVTPDALDMSNNNPFTFSASINRNELDILNEWRKNEIIYCKLEINGVVLSNSELFEIYGSTKYQISKELFETDILQPMDLLTGYIRRFPTAFVVDTQDPNLEKFFDHLEAFHCNLNTACSEMKRSKPSDGYNHSLRQIRISLDSLKSLRNDQNVFDALVDLIETKGTITPFPADAVNQTPRLRASIDIINSLFDTFNMIFDFSSKALHTTSKGGQNNFEMKSDLEDIEYILTVSYSITEYLRSKLMK